MAYTVNFKAVETIGLESSPVARALAGLRANEARYFWSHFKHEYVVYAPEEKPEVLPFVEKILLEKGLAFPYEALQVTQFEVEGVSWSYVFYENGLAVNVLYTLEDGGKRAVGFKLSEGMEIPAEFEGKFKFARQKSALAGEIRGSFFKIKGEYL